MDGKVHALYWVYTGPSPAYALEGYRAFAEMCLRRLEHWEARVEEVEFGDGALYAVQLEDDDPLARAWFTSEQYLKCFDKAPMMTLLRGHLPKLDKGYKEDFQNCPNLFDFPF